MTTPKCVLCGKRVDPVVVVHPQCSENLPPISRAVTGVEIIQTWASSNDVFSSNDLRPVFDRWGIKETARGPAFAAAQRAGYIRAAGHVPSTGEKTRNHDVKTYESLITGRALLERRQAS